MDSDWRESESTCRTCPHDRCLRACLARRQVANSESTTAGARGSGRNRSSGSPASGNEYGVLVGLLQGKVSATGLVDVISNRKTLDLRLLEVGRIFAQ